MPSDNTTLPTGGGGDTIRDLDRGRSDGAKTEVVQLDVGGDSSQAESLVSRRNPLPVYVLDPDTLPARQLDDDGIPLVNPNAPGADIATGTLQQLQLEAINGPITFPGIATSVVVGTSSVPIVAANANRTGLILTNVSASGQRIALGLNGGIAGLDQGIVLWPQQWWSMDRYCFTLSAVTAIASAASGAIAIQEFS